MPSLKDALQKPTNVGSPITAPAPPAAPAITPREQPGLAVGSLGPAPSIFTTDYDRVRQWYRPGTSQNRFPPLPLKVNPQLGAISRSNSTAIAVSSSDDDNTVLDGITHGTVPWWTDPGFIYWREDFLGGVLPSMWPGSGAGTPGVAYAGDWINFGSAFSRTTFGGNPPHAGIFAWSQTQTSSGFGGIMLNTNGDAGGSTNVTSRTMALLENPGWKMSWVFQFMGQAGNSSTTGADWAKKSFYCGLVGPGIGAIHPNNSTMGLGFSARPDCFFGLRYDTSHTPESWGLSQVGAGGGGNTVYTPHALAAGGLFQAAANQYINATIVVTGCANANNNGTFTCVANTTTTLTLNNPNGVVDNGVSASAVIRPTKLNITAVTQNTPAAGQTAYTVATHVSVAGTAGTTGGYHGQTITVAGCTNAGNNGTFTVIGSGINGTNTLIYVTNAGTTEVPAANTAFVTFTDGINDFGGNFKFEYVNNPQWNNAQIRHNVPGTVVDTGIAPTFGHWYRLDMSCSATGIVTISLLDETAAATVSSVYTIPKMVVNATGLSLVSDINKQVVVSLAPDGAGFNATPKVSFPQFGADGSVITISAVTGNPAVLNGTWTTYPNNALFSIGNWNAVITQTNAITFDATHTATLTGYPSFTPIVLWGCDDSGGNTAFPNASWCAVDLFTFVWNPNLGPGAPGTPNALKSRYW